MPYKVQRSPYSQTERPLSPPRVIMSIVSRKNGLWVRASREGRLGDPTESVITFKVGNVTAHSPKQGPSSHALGPLTVWISLDVLGEEWSGANIKGASPICVVDPVAFELAEALRVFDSLPSYSADTKTHLCNMLCAQLSSRVPAKFISQNQRAAGFEPWQRQRLETTLSSMGTKVITLEAAAARCGLSVCHFARLFKKAYGRPFYQHVIECKMARACELLGRTDDPVSQIALECGFSDQSSFTRRFSAKLGKSPASFRESPIRRYSYRPSS